MHAKKTTMLAVLGLLVANTTYAGSLVTPGLPKGSATASFLCTVVNTGSSEAGPVLFEIVGEAGAVVSSITFSIPAGATRSIASSGGSGPNYCRVTGISKGKARVTLCTRDTGFNCTQNVTIP